MNIFYFTVIGEEVMNYLTKTNDLNMSQIRLLLFFDQTDNQIMSMKELAAGLDISLSTLSRQLKQATTKTYLNVDETTKDSTKLVSLNESGLVKARNLNQSINDLETKLFSFWDQDDLNKLEAELKMILKKLKS